MAMVFSFAGPTWLGCKRGLGGGYCDYRGYSRKAWGCVALIERGLQQRVSEALVLSSGWWSLSAAPVGASPDRLSVLFLPLGVGDCGRRNAVCDSS